MERGFRRLVVWCIAAMVQAAPVAAADGLVGTWATPRDNKGIVGHVEVKFCGAPAVCGVIMRTYDQEGHQVHTRNLGVRVFWDMLPAGEGRWEGMAYVPLYDKTYKGQITLNGNQAKVGGCFGPICKSQVWTRVW
jgi:uncharacterized protein (DUF2147 family)